MDYPPSYDDAVHVCPNPYIASRELQSPEPRHTQPLQATNLLRHHFDPKCIAVRDEGSAGQVASAPMPHRWTAQGVSEVDWAVFVGQVAGVKDSADGNAVGVLAGEWNAWFFAPRGCLVVLAVEEEEEELVPEGGGGAARGEGAEDGFFLARDGKIGLRLGGVFLGLVGTEREFGIKVGPLTLGVVSFGEEAKKGRVAEGEMENGYAGEEMRGCD